MVRYTISLIPGDGIGPEQMQATLKVLNAVERKFGISFKFLELKAGDRCYEELGTPLPDETIEAIKNSHACLKGPVGETAADVIVRLRILFDLYANVRPAKSYPNIPCLKPNIDLVIVRENTEDVYRGIEFQIGDSAIALRIITKKGCERIAKYAFELAKKRKKKVTAVHKANVMRKTCGLFAKICREISSQYPDVQYEELYVDAAAMRLIKSPEDFDVIVTTNMFGDILSDEAAQLIGGLGVAPAANIGENFAIFEPVHGSAPKLAGKGIANPISLILTSKLMFEWMSSRYKDSKLSEAAKSIEKAVIRTLSQGVMTPDLGGNAKTVEVGEIVAENLA